MYEARALCARLVSVVLYLGGGPLLRLVLRSCVIWPTTGNHFLVQMQLGLPWPTPESLWESFESPWGVLRCS